MPSTKPLLTRRDFMATSAGALSAATLLKPASIAAFQNSDTIRVGLIGCGGRGTGAASQALTADSNVVLWSMGDMFPERIESSLGGLKEHESKERVQVSADRKFTGIDAYQKVIDSGVDVVLLASPPGFRPQQLKAAVAAGKHIFCEKPMAVDAPGVRSVIESSAEAKKRRLALVSGFCWRYSAPERAVYERILGGALGEIQSLHSTYHTGTLGTRTRESNWSDLEFQLRNWQHFVWLSGDIIAEQAVHSVDKMNWAMNNEAPVRATGIGGRGNRQGPERGNVYDHFTVIYEYASGARAFLTCRQQNGCSNDNSDWLVGTKGSATINGWGPTQIIKGENPWQWDRNLPRTDMYQTEHNELFSSIRTGQPINDGEWMVRSTMMAIMGRMCAYTGQTLTWEQVINSKEDTFPADLASGEAPPVTIAQPGITKFI